MKYKVTFYADGKIEDWEGHDLLFATENDAIEYAEYWTLMEGYEYSITLKEVQDV